MLFPMSDLMQVIIYIQYTCQEGRRYLFEHDDVNDIYDQIIDVHHLRDGDGGGGEQQDNYSNYSPDTLDCSSRPSYIYRNT